MHHKGQEVRNSAVLTNDVMKSLQQKVGVRSRKLSQQRKGRKAQLSKLGRAVGRPNWAGRGSLAKRNKTYFSALTSPNYDFQPSGLAITRSTSMTSVIVLA